MMSVSSLQQKDKVAIVHHDLAAIAFCSYIIETSEDFSAWEILFVGDLLQQTKQLLEDLGVRELRVFGDIRGLELSELALFPATMSLGNWFVVNTRGVKVQKLIAALDGPRNIGMLGPSIAQRNTEIVTFLSSSPDPHFENEVKPKSSKLSETVVGLESFSKALTSWCSYFSINPPEKAKPILSRDDILYIYRDGWNESWAPTLSEQFDKLKSHVLEDGEVKRLVIVGPRNPLNSSISEEDLIQTAIRSMPYSLEVVSWRQIVAVYFPESSTTSIDVFQHAGYLGTPKTIFQYEGTSAINLFAISRKLETEVLGLQIIRNAGGAKSPKFRAILEQSFWLENLLQGLKRNEDIVEGQGVSRDFYLLTMRRAMRRTAVSFILCKLHPKLYNIAARLLRLD